MALTRAFLKGMNLTDEQVGAIIEAHTETVDALKAQRDSYEADAKKLPTVQKELDDLKAAGDGGFEKKYNDEKAAHDALKQQIADQQSKAAKESAVKAYYEGKNIKGDNLKIAMRGTDLSAVEVADGKIKDTKALDDLVAGDFKALVSTTSTGGADSHNPPGGQQGTNDDDLSDADYYAKVFGKEKK